MAFTPLNTKSRHVGDHSLGIRPPLGTIFMYLHKPVGAREAPSSHSSGNFTRQARAWGAFLEVGRFRSA